MQRITPGQLVARREQGELWQILDVRERWEITIASLDEAIVMPMAEVPVRYAELDPALPVAVMCHSGIRSAQVAVWLAGRGFDTVANLEGGIDAWALEIDASIARY